MSQKLGELRMVPVSAIHPDPDNPRVAMGDIDQLAHELKTVGQMDAITVYPHPELDGDYMILGGHRRHAAALRAGLTEMKCEIIAAPQNRKAELFTEALTTGSNHATLNTDERGMAIQGLLTEGKSEAWIARNFKIDKSEVKPRATLSKNKDLADRFDAGKLDLLGVKRLIDLEESSGDPEIVERVTDEVANGRSWITFDESEVERLIAQEERAKARKIARDRLEAMGGQELDHEHRYSGKYTITKRIMSDQEHIDAGHLYDADPDGVTWWMKTPKPEKKVSPEEAAKKETIRRINNELPASKRARQTFFLAKIRDKKALTESEDRGLMIDMMLTNENGFGLSTDQGVLIGEALMNPYPMPEGDESEYSDEVSERRSLWEQKARVELAKWSLGQLVRVQAMMRAAAVEDSSFRFNAFMRDSYEKNARWWPLGFWYAQLIRFFGYRPDQSEIDAIKVGYKERDHGRGKRGVEVVDLLEEKFPGSTNQACQKCGQLSLAKGSPDEPCPTCESEEA